MTAARHVAVSRPLAATALTQTGRPSSTKAARARQFHQGLATGDVGSFSKQAESSTPDPISEPTRNCVLARWSGIHR
jgi:hypothetical protein